MNTPRENIGRAVGGALVVLLGMTVTAWAEQPNFNADQLDYFEKHVRPVLAEHCYECHSVEDQEAGLRLDARSFLMEGGDSGAAIKPGDPEASRLVRAIRYNDVNFQMPPRYQLEPEDVEALERWVEMGAPWPDEPVPQAEEEEAFEVKMERLGETHWSLQPIEKPDLPEVENAGEADWSKSPIDRFLLAKLDQADLQPSPRADRRTLIRRAYFDLIGLPPTYEQVQDFVNDDSPDAWEKVIEELLASPHYGERWGRHWLDVARYGDTTGYIAGSQPTEYPYAYTYRDYVINAFNNDKPYDQFIIEQLAADKLGLEGDDREALAAMGLLTVGRRFQNNKHDIIDDRIDVVTRGFMGLSVSCARCHDHMYDPVPTADYYSLYGVFASSHEPDEKPLVRDPEPTPEYEAYKEGLAELEQEKADWLEDRRVEIQHELRSRVADYLVHIARQQAGEDPSRQGERGALLPHAINLWKRYLNQQNDQPVWRLWHELAALDQDDFAAAAKEVLERDREDGQVNAHILAALRDQPPQTMIDAAKTYGSAIEHIYNQWREKTENASPEDQPDGLDAPAAEQVRQVLLSNGSPATVEGEPRRLLNQGQRNRLGQFDSQIERYTANTPGAPARAMVMRDNENPHNPYIFRRGQAGNRGDNVPRRFLQVLDHVDGGETYDDTSGRLKLAKSIASDKNPLTPRVIVNRIWQHHFGHGIVRTPSDFGTRGERPTHPELLDWLAAQFMEDGWSMKQMHRRIMLSEAYRQQSNDRSVARQEDPENRLLWKMNRQRLEFEPLRDAVLAVSGRLDRTIGGRSVQIHEDSPRRAVYAYLDREDLPGLFRNFDVANPDVTTAVRPDTTVPQQSLYMLNAPFITNQAERLAERAHAEAEDDSTQARIEALYRLTLGRQPTSDERTLGEQFVSGPDEPIEKPTPRWQFGYGRYDTEQERLVSFEHLPHFTGDSWQGGPELPDPELSWTSLRANGGHPGPGEERAVVRRFEAPASGTVTIQGVVSHPAEQGDGVVGWIVSDRSGELGQWKVHNGEAEAKVSNLEVEAGETIDFVVASGPTLSHDGFQWAPVVRYESVEVGQSGVSAGQALNAEQQFLASSEASEHYETMGLWAQYAQVLLGSNEFAFVD